MRISARCPQCGRVELGRSDLSLVAMPPRAVGDASGRGECGAAWYVYDCTGCARQIVVDVPPTVVVALVSIGVPVWRIPAEVLERGSGGGAPVGMDDVLDAMLWLRDADADDARTAAA